MGDRQTPLQSYRQAGSPTIFQFLQGFTETHLPHNAPTLWQEGQASLKILLQRGETEPKGREDRKGERSWQREVP